MLLQYNGVLFLLGIIFALIIWQLDDYVKGVPVWTFYAAWGIGFLIPSQNWWMGGLTLWGLFGSFTISYPLIFAGAYASGVRQGKIPGIKIPMWVPGPLTAIYLIYFYFVS